MNNEEREKLKKYLPDYLQSKGIDYIHNKLFRCLSPYHEDNHPSMVYYPNRQVCHCFACGADLDIFAIIGIDYGISNFTEQVAKICEIYNIPNQSLKYEKPTYRRNYKTQKFINTVKEKEQEQSTIPTDFSEYLSECAMYLEKAVKLNLNDINQFLDRRGLTLNTIKHFNCGLDPKWKSPKVTKENKIPYSPRFIIPSSKYGYLARNIRDRSSLSDFQIRTEKMKTGQLDLFNKTALNNAKGICFITEGEIDAMSVYQTGFDAVALGTTAMVNSFFKAIEDIGTNSIIIPLLDNDNAGKVTTEKIESGLKERGLSFYHINNFCLNAKDPNEALVRNTSWFYEWIRHTALCAWLENTKQDESKLSLNYILAKTCATASVLNDQQDNVIFSSKLDITKNPVNILITKTDDKGHSSVYMYNYENQSKTLKFNYGFDKTSSIKKQQIPCDVEKLIESCSNNIQKYLENKKSELYYEKSHS